MRILVVGFGLVVLAGGAATPATAQWLVTDARRIGMGGLSLGRSGSVARYNPAYRAVSAKAEQRHGQPKVTIRFRSGSFSFCTITRTSPVTRPSTGNRRASIRSWS